MKLIALTQRVDINKENNERRDTLDQRWIFFLKDCNFIPLLIPNNLTLTKSLIEINKVSGILLTGGNDLCVHGGDSPERDETEFFLIDYAISNSLPILGVCRGMEVIQHYFGIKLEKIAGHSSVEHELLINGSKRKVNSYHNFGAVGSTNDLEIVAKASDGVIEAIVHSKLPIKGIMWHPERYNIFQEEDVKLFKETFN